MATKTKPAAKKSSAKKDPAHEKMLGKFNHHKGMAAKHRAHADLIEAKLRTQGKRIREGFGEEKTTVVDDSPSRY